MASAFWPEQIRDLDKSLHGDLLVVIVQMVACVITILSVLSPFPVIRKVAKRRSTGEFSHLPYSLNFFNSTLALIYGFHVRNRFLIMINTFCVFTTCGFLLTYQRFSAQRPLLRVYSLLGFLMSVLIFWYAHMLGDAKGRTLLGSVQNFVTCCCYASPLATLGTVLRTKSAESLPFLLVLMSCISGMAWLLYGLLIQDVFVQFPSLVGTTLSFFQLSLFAIYPSTKILIF
mmetsp:Transcript_47268/g.115104  ORF Transcript_47268/g.115104 Transcript_47268/m.115104 type:complete len:230 (-) Transcript_47268:445-1134(-)